MPWKSSKGELLYRIGDVIISTNTQNPSAFFGGKWQLLCPGKTLVCVDTADNDFNTVKKTGGSKYLQSHNHSASSQSAGEHGHSGTANWIDLQGDFYDLARQDDGAGISANGIISVFQSGSWAGWGTSRSQSKNDSFHINASHQHALSINNNGSHTHSIAVNSSGDGNAQNLQPFMAVYMWVRIA